MIKITDRTFSCISGTINVVSALHFLKLLIQAGVDFIELSEDMYKTLSPLPVFPSYVLRMKHARDCANYPDIAKYVCHNETAPNVRTEILMNDRRESYTVARFAEYGEVRITGLDDCLLGDYLHTFKYLKKAFYGNVEFCPGNRLGCASALAAEWVMSGTGKEIVTSFNGIGGFAPTEEVIMLLRLQRLRKIGKTYKFFPKMASLFHTITGNSVHGNKPIIGEKIFHVESGIHVDGIIKNPKCYEPFSPEIVGLKHEIILGKQSGSASVRAKLEELGIKCCEEQIPLLLRQVKAVSSKKNGSITNSEFAEIARAVYHERKKVSC